jgi:GNAT superfamily N-acetyltransferase
MKHELRQAFESDKEYLVSLHKRCYREVVESQFGNWDDEIQRVFFEKKWKPSKFQMIIVGGEKAGVVSAEHLAEHFLLSEIQIEPRLQNQGLGSQIIKAILSEACAQNLPVRLQVLKKSNAKNLYLCLGFVQTGETDTHLLMEKMPC